MREEAARKWEHGNPLPSKRFDAAEEMKKAGWPNSLPARSDRSLMTIGRYGYSEAIKTHKCDSPRNGYSWSVESYIRQSAAACIEGQRKRRFYFDYFFVEEKNSSDSNTEFDSNPRSECADSQSRGSAATSRQHCGRKAKAYEEKSDSKFNGLLFYTGKKLVTEEVLCLHLGNAPNQES